MPGKYHALIRFAFLIALAPLAACALEPAPLKPMISQQPANLSEIKTQILHYKNSGQYDREIAAVDADAQDYVERRAMQVSHPALILDIDETSLSNWPQQKANDFANVPDVPCRHLPKGPCGMQAWQKRAEAKPILPTLALFKAAKEQGVAVFFITGRDESLRSATEKNLRKAGYKGWKQLIMRPAGTMTPAADYKTPARAKIAQQGYTIIANVGDQPSDLAGGHAEQIFLLPDPFYRIP